MFALSSDPSFGDGCQTTEIALVTIPGPYYSEFRYWVFTICLGNECSGKHVPLPLEPCHCTAAGGTGALDPETRSGIESHVALNEVW